jgi:hypothetical protein
VGSAESGESKQGFTTNYSRIRLVFNPRCTTPATRSWRSPRAPHEWVYQSAGDIDPTNNLIDSHSLVPYNSLCSFLDRSQPWLKENGPARLAGDQRVREFEDSRLKVKIENQVSCGPGAKLRIRVSGIGQLSNKLLKNGG